jgi:hypothetical protein
MACPPVNPCARCARPSSAEVADLRTQLGQLGRADRTLLASPAAFRLADRYAAVLAAAACVGIWRYNPGQPSTFLQEDAWLVAALTRLARRLGRAGNWSGVYEAVVPELLARHEQHRAFDLVGRRLA